MSSLRGVALGVQAPRVSLRPKAHDLQDAEDAIQFAGSYGLVPDEWQAWTIRGWLARGKTGKLASSRCGQSVPRQNGKNGNLEIVELFKMVILGRKILHTAHEVKTARKAFIRLTSFFENERQHPELAALVKEIRRTNGQEAIVLRNGGSCEFIARSKGSGRGFTVDDLVCDEAQELDEDALAALLPTISAAPSGDPQLILTGTPPAPNMRGDAFARMRAAGMDGKDARLCWDEWSCARPVDVDDVKAWAQANPSLGGRLHRETIEDERAVMDEDTFMRERLGMWDEDASGAVIDMTVWADGTLEPSEVERPEVVAFALDVPPDRSTASIGIVGARSDGSVHMQTDQGTAGHRGTAWVPARLAELQAKWGPCAVVLDASGPAGSLLAPLLEAGVEVTTTSAREMGQACGLFFDAATEGRVRHLGEPRLNAALTAARKRPLGDAWAWHRKGTTDISPLVAVTLAHWGFATRAQREPKIKAPSAAFAF